MRSVNGEPAPMPSHHAGAPARYFASVSCRTLAVRAAERRRGDPTPYPLEAINNMVGAGLPPATSPYSDNWAPSVSTT